MKELNNQIFGQNNLLFIVTSTCDVIYLKPNDYAYCKSNGNVYYINANRGIYRSMQKFTSYAAAQLFILRQENFNEFYFIRRKKFINQIRSHFHNPNVKKKLFEQQKGICLVCNKQMIFKTERIKTPKNYATIDHVIPINKGGSFKEENLQLLCYRCNHKKSDKIIEPKITI